jgi:hypothetical protein
MATNKNATIRYQTLNRCFRNPGRKYYIEDLVEACNDSLLDIDPSSTGLMPQLSLLKTAEKLITDTVIRHSQSTISH